MTTQRERLIRRVARTIVWTEAETWRKESARAKAIAIVDDLLRGSAEGKAVERAVRTIVTNLERSA